MVLNIQTGESEKDGFGTDALKFLVKEAGKQWNYDVQQSDKRYAEVAVFYLNTLSRELGNELVQRDPDFFKRNNRLMLQEWVIQLEVFSIFSLQ